MLQRHHGAGMAARDGSRKDDWLCKRCKDSDGRPFKNFGSRDACMRCKVDKGRSCGGKPPSTKPPSERRPNFAEGQERRAKADDARQKVEAKAKKAEAEAKALRQEVAELKAGKMPPLSEERRLSAKDAEGDEAMAEAKCERAHSLAFYVAREKLMREHKVPTFHPDWVANQERIKKIRREDREAKPLPERLQKLHKMVEEQAKSVAAAQEKLENSRGQVEKDQSTLHGRQEKLASLQEEYDKLLNSKPAFPAPQAPQHMHASIGDMLLELGTRLQVVPTTAWGNEGLLDILKATHVGVEAFEKDQEARRNAERQQVEAETSVRATEPLVAEVGVGARADADGGSNGGDGRGNDGRGRSRSRSRGCVDIAFDDLQRAAEFGDTEDLDPTSWSEEVRSKRLAAFVALYSEGKRRKSTP